MVFDLLFRHLKNMMSVSLFLGIDLIMEPNVDADIDAKLIMA
jgi:hypothetical protein